MTTMFQRLASPFPAEAISWRVGSTNQEKTKGMALAFIDARDVMDRLDEVVGPENWQDRYTHADKKTVCEIDIWVEGRGWVTKADGAGDSDVEAEKGSLSDAFKRAAVRWGVGRYLYSLDSPWVAITARGRFFVIAEGEHAKLRAMLTRDAQSRSVPVQAATVPAGFVDVARKRIGQAESKAELQAWMKLNSELLSALDEAERQDLRAAAEATLKKFPATLNKAA